MSHESSEFMNRVVDESTIEYAQKAEEKREAVEQDNPLTQYLASRQEGDDRIRAVLFIASYCMIYAPNIVQSAIAIHKVEYPTS